MAKQMIDIKVGSDLDLDFTGSDLSYTESTVVHQEDLIVCGSGDFKENPQVGVGVWDFMDSEDTSDLIREISLQFAGDGMNVVGIVLQPSGVISSNAFYV